MKITLKSSTQWIAIGWWESPIFWPHSLKVTATQVPMSFKDDPSRQMCTATVTIKDCGFVVFESKAPFIAMRTEQFLLQQIYNLANHDKFPFPKWKPILTSFCKQHTYFIEPRQPHWI